MSKDTGEPAFPQTNFTMNVQSGSEGMTLRDYFAGQALIGMCQSLTPEQIIAISDGTLGGKSIIGASFRLATAMIAERSKDDE